MGMPTAVKPADRATVRAMFFAGHSYAEISAATGLPRHVIGCMAQASGFFVDVTTRDPATLAPAEARLRALLAENPPVDDAYFAELWVLDVPTAMIARLCDSTFQRMKSWAARLHLPPRMIKPAAEERPAPAKAPAAAPQGMDQLSFQVLKTGGRYAALAELAGQTNVPQARLLQRWHQLRAGRVAA